MIHSYSGDAWDISRRLMNRPDVTRRTVTPPEGRPHIELGIEEATRMLLAARNGREG